VSLYEALQIPEIRREDHPPESEGHRDGNQENDSALKHHGANTAKARAGYGGHDGDQEETGPEPEEKLERAKSGVELSMKHAGGACAKQHRRTCDLWDLRNHEPDKVPPRKK